MIGPASALSKRAAVCYRRTAPRARSILENRAVRLGVAHADRYRTPATSEYIDAFQRLSLADEPIDVKQEQAARLSELERDLLRSLGPSPAWTAELDGGASVR